MRLDDEALDLYRNSRHAWHEGRIDDATEFYARLRRDHGIEIHFETDLPESVRLIHALGSVLGRASYGNYFVCYHGCGVGSDLDGGRPTIGAGVVLFPSAKILGKVTIGDNVFVTANTLIQALPGHPVKVPGDVVVFPTATGFGYKSTSRNVKQRFFDV